MSEDAAERCWFHRFYGDDPCPRRGEWGWRDAPDAITRLMRWCSEHKHDTDVRMPLPQPPVDPGAPR